MKLSLSMAAVLATLLATPLAAAQSPTQHQTADYVERSLGGDAVITFLGDPLAAPPGGAYGDTVRRPPGIMRAGLIRPRLNFVVELLKTVENL